MALRVRKPHTHARTIQSNWEDVPKTYQVECNIVDCYWQSASRMERDVVVALGRQHHADKHNNEEVVVS